MDFEKFTERSRGFVQSAQTLALGRGHQRFTPEHLLKVVLDDKEGLAANLLRAAGGRPADALKGVELELGKLPRVEGAGQLYLAPELARLFDEAEKLADKAGDSFITAERLLLALALAKGTPSARVLEESGVTPQNLAAAHARHYQQPLSFRTGRQRQVFLLCQVRPEHRLDRLGRLTRLGGEENTAGPAVQTMREARLVG